MVAQQPNVTVFSNQHTLLYFFTVIYLTKHLYMCYMLALRKTKQNKKTQPQSIHLTSGPFLTFPNK